MSLCMIGHNFDIVTFYKSLTSTHFTFIPFVFSLPNQCFFKKWICVRESMTEANMEPWQVNPNRHPVYVFLADLQSLLSTFKCTNGCHWHWMYMLRNWLIVLNPFFPLSFFTIWSGKKESQPFFQIKDFYYPEDWAVSKSYQIKMPWCSEKLCLASLECYTCRLP